jgi:hypothetical protein
MTNQNTFDKVMDRDIKPDLVRGFQSKWDEEQRQNHYGLRCDGVVLECANILYPYHISNFGGINGQWVVSSLKAEDLRELEFIGFYPMPRVAH